MTPDPTSRGVKIQPTQKGQDSGFFGSQREFVASSAQLGRPA